MVCVAEFLKGVKLARWLASMVQSSEQLQACRAYILAWNGYQRTMKKRVLAQDHLEYDLLMEHLGLEDAGT